MGMYAAAKEDVVFFLRFNPFDKEANAMLLLITEENKLTDS